MIARGRRNSAIISYLHSLFASYALLQRGAVSDRLGSLLDERTLVLLLSIKLSVVSHEFPCCLVLLLLSSVSLGLPNHWAQQTTILISQLSMLLLNLGSIQCKQLLDSLQDVVGSGDGDRWGLILHKDVLNDAILDNGGVSLRSVVA